MRIGFGYDVHRLELGQKLILGGVHIPNDYGLKGHSDADVLLHAICDALLGAAALGDIGRHFPDTNPEFKGISSRELLKKVKYLVSSAGYTIINVDSTIVLERPKIFPYVEEMRFNIATALEVNVDSISIKATTNERVGFIGRAEGCAAFAIAMIVQSH